MTSTHSINECRIAIEELIKEMLMAGFGNNNNNHTNVNEKNGDDNESIPKINSENDEQQDQEETLGGNQLILQQIKIVDVEGNLRTVYPSKTDLFYDEKYQITVQRE